MNRGTYRKLWRDPWRGRSDARRRVGAMALELKEEHQGITVSWDENGTPVIDRRLLGLRPECEAPARAKSFSTSSSPARAWRRTPWRRPPTRPRRRLRRRGRRRSAPRADDVKDNNVDWFVPVDASDGEITLETANSNVRWRGRACGMSHICVGDAARARRPSRRRKPPTDTADDSDRPDAVPERVRRDRRADRDALPERRGRHGRAVRARHGHHRCARRTSAARLMAHGCSWLRSACSLRASSSSPRRERRLPAANRAVPTGT